jgi:hypothetical protein
VVEGAGGALVPLGEDLLYADLFARWGLPVVVARSGLGTINHSLLTWRRCGRGALPRGHRLHRPRGEAEAESERIICARGRVRRLGHLPVLAAHPANAGRRHGRFRSGGAGMTRSPIWHPFTQHGLGEPIPLVTHARGQPVHRRWRAGGRCGVELVGDDPRPCPPAHRRRHCRSGASWTS